MIQSIFEKRVLNRFQRQVGEMKRISELHKKLSNEDFKRKFSYYNNQENINIPALLSLLEQAVIKSLRITPYPEQYWCALALAEGYVAEMKTGEGKTLACALAACLSVHKGKVHIATVNDYLAERDCEKMRPLFDLLGISTAVNVKDHPNKSEVYEADIVYSSSSELVFDYIRNELRPIQEQSAFPLDVVIIDEIDFVLIDNAKNNFAVSEGYTFIPPFEVYNMAADLYKAMMGRAYSKSDYEEEELDVPEDIHYIYFPFNRTVHLTERGHNLVDKVFQKENTLIENAKLNKVLLSTLEAHLFCERGRDYVVQDHKVWLINRENGRLMPNSQLDVDLQSAIETKENVMISPKAVMSQTMSYQIFFSKYDSMVGLSGTVYEAREELRDLFRASVIPIPSHFQSQRKLYPDSFFATKADKYKALYHLLLHEQNGRPILVICESDAEAMTVHREFLRLGGSANLLISLSEKEESELIEKAGTSGTITISTNMAGRGTDIVLDSQAKEAGGLRVIVLNHFESKRIDQQAIGRAGRQGCKGDAMFLVSSEDSLFEQMNQRETQKLSEIKSSREKKRSRWLMTLIGKLQDAQQGLHAAARLRNFLLDLQIEEIYRMMKGWKADILSAPALSALTDFAQSEAFSEDRFDELMEQNATLYTSDDVFELIHAKHMELGERVSNLLLEQLIHSVTQKEWVFLKRDLEQVKTYLPHHQWKPEEEPREFLRICFEQWELAKNNILLHTLAYFVTAKQNS